MWRSPFRAAIKRDVALSGPRSSAGLWPATRIHRDNVNRTVTVINTATGSPLSTLGVYRH